jgi:hypothetical protein
MNYALSMCTRAQDAGELKAGARGALYLELDASLNAEAFYLRHGYTATARGTHRFATGCDMDCIKMRKSLSAAERLR